MTAVAASETRPRRPTHGWAIVARQELRDLWLGGRGLLLVLAFSALLSVIAEIATLGLLAAWWTYLLRHRAPANPKTDIT